MTIASLHMHRVGAQHRTQCQQRGGAPRIATAVPCKAAPGELAPLKLQTSVRVGNLVLQRHSIAAWQQGQRKRVVVSALYGGWEPSPADSYVCLGVAHCFEKDDEGKLKPKFIIEPLTANSLEGMAAGARTSFQVVTGTTLGKALAQDKNELPEEFSEASYCNNFAYRCEAAARTWLRPHAQDNLMDIVPLGKVRSNFIFSVEDKRVLNAEFIVSDADNIKQDMSIDVYGRKEKTAEPTATQASQASDEDSKKQAEDDLEALLAA